MDERKAWLIKEYALAKMVQDLDRMQEIACELYEMYGYIAR